MMEKKIFRLSITLQEFKEENFFTLSDVWQVVKGKEKILNKLKDLCQITSKYIEEDI